MTWVVGHDGGDDQRGGTGDGSEVGRPCDDQGDVGVGDTGSTTFTVTAAVLSSIAVTPANPSLRRREDAAVHGDRDLQRQLDAET